MTYLLWTVGGLFAIGVVAEVRYQMLRTQRKNAVMVIMMNDRGWMLARYLRATMATKGNAIHGVYFYRLMAEMEDDGHVEYEDRKLTINGHAVTERYYLLKPIKCHCST